MFWSQKRADAKKVRKALESYPVYRPPYPGDRDGVSVEHGRENYDYFLRNKDRRSAYLQSFLAAFETPLVFDELGLKAVDAWFHRHGAYLTGEDGGLNLIAFNRFVPEWTSSSLWPQSFAGLNAVWDLGTYVGDFVIKLNPKCNWIYNDGTWRRGGDNSYAYLKPCLSLQQTCQPRDVLGNMLHTAENKQLVIERKIRGGMFGLAPDALEKMIESYASPTVPKFYVKPAESRPAKKR